MDLPYKFGVVGFFFILEISSNGKCHVPKTCRKNAKKKTCTTNKQKCVLKYSDLRHVTVWAQKSVELVEPVCKQCRTDTGSRLSSWSDFGSTAVVELLKQMKCLWFIHTPLKLMVQGSLNIWNCFSVCASDFNPNVFTGKFNTSEIIWFLFP